MVSARKFGSRSRARDRLVSLDAQLNLPAQAVQFQYPFHRKPLSWDRSEDDDEIRHLQGFRSDVVPLLAVAAALAPLRPSRGGAAGAQRRPRMAAWPCGCTQAAHSRGLHGFLSAFSFPRTSMRLLAVIIKGQRATIVPYQDVGSCRRDGGDPMGGWRSRESPIHSWSARIRFAKRRNVSPPLSSVTSMLIS